MRAFTILLAVWFPPGLTAGSYSAWYTEGRAPESGLNVWPASPGPGSNIARPGGRGPALEFTTCDRQGEEILEDRNNQIRHHLKWNIYSDDGKWEASLLGSVVMTVCMKRGSWKSTPQRPVQAFAVYRFNCLRMQIGNELTTGWFPAWLSQMHAHFHTLKWVMWKQTLDKHNLRAN